MKLKRKVYETRQEKRTDFFLGFFGWYAVNAVIVFITFGLANPYFTSEAAVIILLALPLAINAIAIVLLALSRSWIALGALAAIGAVFLLVLAAAALIFIACSSAF